MIHKCFDPLIDMISTLVNHVGKSMSGITDRVGRKDQIEINIDNVWDENKKIVWDKIKIFVIYI